MTKLELFENAINDWKQQRCKGSMIVSETINTLELVVEVLQKIYKIETNNTFRTIIVTPMFSYRQEIIDYLKQYPCLKNVLDTRHLNVFTELYYIKDRNSFATSLTIWLKPDDKTKSFLDDNSKFGLCIFTRRLEQDIMSKVLSIYPAVKTFTNTDTNEIRMSTPVEEVLIDVTIPEDSEDYKLLKRYDEYISSSMAIFGDFKTMDKCRRGDMENNISAVDIAYQIAQNNGWSPNLDMSFDYNVQLDAIYNPSALQDRAKQIYEIVRTRQKLLTDYNPKIDKVYEIVKENNDKKILIISKRGEFANAITSYINVKSNADICGNFHDKVEPIKATDANGNYVCYKSGAKKGQYRYLGAQAQKTLNMYLFNNNEINILSTSAAPDKDLDVKVDVVIITSPTCGEIENYLYRLSKLKLANKIKLYTIYVSDSIEQRIIDTKKETETHKIINKCEKLYDIENNSDFSIVD